MSLQKTTTPKSTGQVFKGALADFVLLNVNRPGATRQLKVVSFTVSKSLYQWLPATFTVKLKNVGNSIVQPSGNIFIARNANSKTPIATLSVNPNGGYILPGSERAIEVQWSSGFPAYKAVSNVNGPVQHKLTWNWSKLNSFRFGKYNASLVAIYDNGNNQDVPLQAQVNFWVLPWEALTAFIVVLLLLLYGLWSFARKLSGMNRRRNRSFSRR
jgi:hypothetical protein